MPKITETHAMFANTAEGVTLRVGQPTTWDRAIRRWYHADDARRRQQRVEVRYMGRWYPVETFEVRSCDKHGRGIGSERHAAAIPVPHAAMRTNRPAGPPSHFESIAALMLQRPNSTPREVGCCPSTMRAYQQAGLVEVTGKVITGKRGRPRLKYSLSSKGYAKARRLIGSN